MKIFCERDNYKLYEGSMLDMMQVLNPCTVDSIVTDPPYNLGFMGKSWDSNGIAFQVETWRKCYQVLKSGGYLLAFGGTRTFHRIACAIEDAGFEIRDTIMWLYGSGFPKSMNIGLAIDKKNGQHKEAQNQWAGWGTALKPAYEPVIVARKPCEGSCVDNVLKYGVGGLNIDGCRVGDELIKGGTMPIMGAGETGVCNFGIIGAERTEGADHNGRYPANVILTYDESDKAEVCGGMPETSEESAARYYYCAKASKRDRDEGLDSFEEKMRTDGNIRSNSETARQFGANSGLSRNIHPTVKPTDLMQYLVRLVTPPPTAQF